MCKKNENVVFDVCLSSESGSPSYDYTFYGDNVNGTFTISKTAFDDIRNNVGLDVTSYVLHCFMMKDKTGVSGAHELTLSFNIDGSIQTKWEEISLEK